jgi:hypothetical protein
MITFDLSTKMNGSCHGIQILSHFYIVLISHVYGWEWGKNQYFVVDVLNTGRGANWVNGWRLS